MGEDGFKNTLFAFVLVALFGVLIISVVVNTGSEYSMNTSEITGGALSLDKFNQSITNVQSSAESMNERFAKGNVWSAIAGVVVEGIFGIAVDIFKMLILPFSLITNVMTDILHIPAFVTSIIMALFIFGIIFGVWRLIKIGD